MMMRLANVKNMKAEKRKADSTIKLQSDKKQQTYER